MAQRPVGLSVGAADGGIKVEMIDVAELDQRSRDPCGARKPGRLDEQNQGGDVVFASIQSLQRNLHRFEPDAIAMRVPAISALIMKGDVSRDSPVCVWVLRSSVAPIWRPSVNTIEAGPSQGSSMAAWYS